MSLVQICNGLHIFKAYIKLMMADSCMILEIQILKLIHNKINFLTLVQHLTDSEEKLMLHHPGQ